MIDAHEVAKNLWVGAYPTNPKACERFDVIVLGAEELQTLPYPCKNILRVPLDDSKPTAEEMARALRGGTVVADLLRKNKKVLVTCAQGVNRSSFIAALALIRSGVAPWRAISMIRDKRKPKIGLTPLSNPHFTKILMSMH